MACRVRIRDLSTNAPEARTREVPTRDVSVVAGDVVVGMDGEFRAHHWAGENAVLNQRLCRLEPIDGFSRVYVREAVRRPLADAERSKSGTTVIHLGKSDIDRFQFVYPGKGLVATFSRLTEPLLDRWLSAEAESRLLRDLRDALLPQLVSGELCLTV